MPGVRVWRTYPPGPSAANGSGGVRLCSLRERRVGFGVAVHGHDETGRKAIFPGADSHSTAGALVRRAGRRLASVQPSTTGDAEPAAIGGPWFELAASSRRYD